MHSCPLLQVTDAGCAAVDVEDEAAERVGNDASIDAAESLERVRPSTESLDRVRVTDEAMEDESTWIEPVRELG